MPPLKIGYISQPTVVLHGIIHEEVFVDQLSFVAHEALTGDDSLQACKPHVLQPCMGCERMGPWGTWTPPIDF